MATEGAASAAALPSLSAVEMEDTSTLNAFSRPPGDVFQMRGPSYLADKVKVNASAPVFQLAHVEAYRVVGRKDHVVTDARSFYQREKAKTGEPEYEYLVIVYQTPEPFGADPAGSRYHLVCHFRRPKRSTDGGGDAAEEAKTGDAGSEAAAPSAAFEALWKKFREGGDEFMKARWKVFPHLAHGPWAVSMAMGSRPALLASKLEHRFFVGDDYVEVDCDVGASLSYLPAISALIGLLQQYASKLVIDVGFAVEAVDEEELPETLLAAVRLHYMEPYSPPCLDEMHSPVPDKK